MEAPFGAKVPKKGRKVNDMKRLKKALALALALTVVFAYTAVGAFAATSDASNAFKVGKLEVSGIKDGNTLKLYKIAQFNYDSATNAFDYTLATGLPADYDTIDEISAIQSDGYEFKEGGSAAKTLADTLANGIAEGTITPIGDAITQEASGNKATIENLPAGWYVAVVSGTADTSIVYQNMLINALPVVDAEHNTYKSAENISLEAKHTTDTVTKTVAGGESTDQYSVGDKVPFTISTTIPNYPTPSKVATFKITDTPSDLTDIITDSGDDKMTVTVGGTAVNRCDDLTAADATYKVTQSGDGFVIEFAKDYILENAGKAVVVTYKATIKESAQIEDDGLTAENTAKITFNPNPNENGTVEPEDETKVYTYGVNVYKYGADTNKKLKGAKFILYKADGETVAGAETEVDDNGYVSWKGLAAGTYKLVETQAPAGYKLDSTPIEVTVSKTTANGDDRASDATETYFLQKDVPNTPGSSLPTTGGIGTTIFYIVGAILVVGAGILLISRRRMAAK